MLRVPQSAAEGALHWFTQGEALECLHNRWLLVWGDSTSRILFSALAHLLKGGAADPSLPPHDFNYRSTACKESHTLSSQGMGCHLHRYFKHANVLISFMFVTRVAVWPAADRVLAKVAQEKAVQAARKRLNQTVPDVVFLNSGPWEYYSHHRDPKDVWNHTDYAQRFTDWLGQWFGTKGHWSSLGSRLVVLGNTACPLPGLCRASHMPCQEAMQKIDRLQVQLLQKFPDNVRSIDSEPIWSPLPVGYNCTGRGYHLPAVVTDARLNLALHAICRSRDKLQARFLSAIRFVSARGIGQ